MADDGELDLNSLSDDDLVQQMHDDLYDGLKEEIEEAVHILLGRGWTPYDTLTKALVAETGAPKIGKMVIGTVKGDIHDIGKNLVAMMMEGAGFEVVNIGINNPVENYLKAIDEHKPDILGMSALLTTPLPYMKVVIDTLIEKGMR